ncbi:MAG: type II secretion system F family protein [Candidatus Eremiobacterota bacterium]
MAFPWSKDRISPASIRLFTLHLSVLLGAGLGLARSLDVLGRGQDDAMSRVARSLSVRVDQGHSLSEAMRTQGEVFPPLYLGLVRVAEVTGQLVKTFERLAATLERQSGIRQRLMSALAYPAFVLVSVLAMTAFLVYFLLPMFMKTFTDSGAELPWMTRMLVTLVTNPWFTSAPPVLGGLLAGSVWVYARQPARRRRLYSALFHVPVLGRFLFLAALSQVTGSLALLLENGVNLTKALDCVRQTPTGWQPLDEALKQVQTLIFEGSELGEALASTRIMPPLLVNMVAAGEPIGTLHPWLRRYTELTEDDLQGRIDALGSVLEPVLLVFLGLVVGFVVLACFLPTYQLITAF